jgi:hypothetical protein
LFFGSLVRDGRVKTRSSFFAPEPAEFILQLLKGDPMIVDFFLEVEDDLDQGFAVEGLQSLPGKA